MPYRNARSAAVLLLGLSLLMACEQTPTVVVVGVDRIEVATPKNSLEVGETAQLSATPFHESGRALKGRTVTWTSSNPQVASVSAEGAVTGMAPGTASITGAAEGKTAAITLNIIAGAVATLAVTPDTFRAVAIGDTLRFRATAANRFGKAIAGATFAWTSSNTAVATVDATGLARATGNGTATVTATAETKSAASGVRVAQEAASLSVSPKTGTIARRRPRESPFDSCRRRPVRSTGHSGSACAGQAGARRETVPEAWA